MHHAIKEEVFNLFGNGDEADESEYKNMLHKHLKLAQDTDQSLRTAAMNVHVGQATGGK